MSAFPTKFNTKILVYSAICIAVATALNMVKLFHMPQGGSVTPFSMFFVSLVGFMFGPIIGILGALAYALLQMIIDPYFVHPIQILLDYILAFTALGLSGFFSNKKYGLYIGFIVACSMRYIFHVVSGYFFFGEFAPENMSVLLYTIMYSLYVPVEAILTLMLLAIPPVRNAINMVKERI